MYSMCSGTKVKSKNVSSHEDSENSGMSLRTAGLYGIADGLQDQVGNAIQDSPESFEVGSLQRLRSLLLDFFHCERGIGNLIQTVSRF